MSKEKLGKSHTLFTEALESIFYEQKKKEKTSWMGNQRSIDPFFSQD
jgi:hypothetical protein